MASPRKLDLFDSVGYTHSHLAPNEDEKVTQKKSLNLNSKEQSIHSVNVTLH